MMKIWMCGGVWIFCDVFDVVFDGGVWWWCFWCFVWGFVWWCVCFYEVWMCVLKCRFLL